MMNVQLLNEVHKEAFDILRRALFDGGPFVWYNADGEVEHEGKEVEQAFRHVLAEVAIALGVKYDPASLRAE